MVLLKRLKKIEKNMLKPACSKLEEGQLLKYNIYLLLFTIFKIIYVMHKLIEMKNSSYFYQKVYKKYNTVRLC